MSTDVLEKITPLVTHHIEVPKSELRFSASCFGGIDWSLKDMYSGSDVYKYPEFAQKLRAALMSVGARQVLAPTPTAFNGEIGLPGELSDTILLGDGVYIRRNKKVPMDGTFLFHRHDAGTFSAGGCGVIVMTYRDHLVFAHAGRESLLDRTWVKSEGVKRRRKHTSVVDSMIDALHVREGELSQVHVWPLYFIKPVDFVHRAYDENEEYRTYNRAAVRFLPSKYGKACGEVSPDEIEMDLAGIARMQCIQRGIPSCNIHRTHEYIPDDLPTTRSPEERDKRYLVVITRLS